MKVVVCCLVLASGILTSCANRVDVEWPASIGTMTPNNRRMDQLLTVTPQLVTASADTSAPNAIKSLAGVWRGCIGGGETGCPIPTVISVGGLNASGATINFVSFQTRRYAAHEALVPMDFIRPDELQGAITSSYKLKLRARRDGNMDAMVVTPELWRGGVWGSHWEVGVLRRD